MKNIKFVLKCHTFRQNRIYQANFFSFKLTKVQPTYIFKRYFIDVLLLLTILYFARQNGVNTQTWTIEPAGGLKHESKEKKADISAKTDNREDSVIRPYFVRLYFIFVPFEITSIVNDKTNRPSSLMNQLHLCSVTLTFYARVCWS